MIWGAFLIVITHRRMNWRSSFSAVAVLLEVLFWLLSGCREDWGAGWPGNTVPCPCRNAKGSSVARERARKIASKNRSSTTTGIGGSFQLANSAPPLGVTGSASAPTARMKERSAARLEQGQRAAWRSGPAAAVKRRARCAGVNVREVPPKGFAPLARVQCQGTCETGAEQARRHGLPREKLL